MDGGGDDDLDGFLLGGDESDDVTTSARPRRTSSHRRRGSATSRTRPRNDGRRRNSTYSSSSLSDDNELRRKTSSSREKNSNAITRRRDENGSDSSPTPKSAKKKNRERHNERNQRRQIDNAVDAVLSSSSDSGDDNDDDDDDENLAAPGRKAKKRQSRLKPKPASDEHMSQAHDIYQAGDAVEARFGGRSKWFPGKVRRSYEGRSTSNVLYDIDYDDGDKEEGVVAGRVRHPGQSAPTLEVGTAVDVKLARKGKGYHAGKIGRVNDDGSFYVKLDDGDSEWSVSAQQIVPAYPFVPTATAPDHGGKSAGPLSRPSSSGITDEDPPQYSAAVNNSPSQDVQPAETTSEPSSAPPPGEQKSERNGDQRSEDNGGGDGGDGGGVSWIAELASSVGVLPARETPSVPGPTADTDKGLGWIKEVVSHVEGGSGASNGSSSSSLPRRGPNTTLSTAVTAGNVSPLPDPDGVGFSTARPTTPTPAAAGIVPSTRPGASSPPPITTPIPTTAPITGGGGGGQTTPLRTNIKPPQPQTPTHLTWKPITDGTASRPWGAPPPDEYKNEIAEGNSGKKREMTSPPRLSRNLRAPEPSSAAADHTSSSHPRGRQDPVAAAGGGESGTAGDNAPPTAKPPPPSQGSKRQESERDSRLPQGDRELTMGAVATGEGELGLEAGEGRKIQGPNCSDSSSGVAAVARDPQGAHEAVPGRGETKTSAEAPKQCPGEPPKTLPPLQEGVSAPVPGDGAARTNTRWDTVRSSVQRRYAAEAVHLSEEVRLLAAKLKAADDKAQARLAQQEHQLIGQMEEVLRRERVKMEAQLTEERASNARRVGALQKELEVARRQLELERNRATKGAARELLHGRRARTPPPLGHSITTGRHATPDAATRRGRRDDRPGSTPRVRCNGHLPGPAEAMASRHRSASSTASARTAASGGVVKSERRSLPPPPPPSVGTASPGKSFAVSAATATSRCGLSETPGISELSGVEFGVEFLLPPTPVEAAALGRGAGGGFDAYDGTAELVTVEGGGTYTEADTDGLPQSSRRYCEERLRWKLETERRDTRRRLEAMKGEVERVVGQFRSRAERAEAAAASAEQRATMKALRYLRSKPQQGKADPSAH